MRARAERLREQYDEQWQSDRDAARGGYAVSPETGTIWAANPNGSSWMPYMQVWTNEQRAAFTEPTDRFTFAHQQRMRAKFPTAPRGKFRDKPRQYLLFLCQALGLLAVAAEATG
jgi:hypothetical protein